MLWSSALKLEKINNGYLLVARGSATLEPTVDPSCDAHTRANDLRLIY